MQDAEFERFSLSFRLGVLAFQKAAETLGLSLQQAAESFRQLAEASKRVPLEDMIAAMPWHYRLYWRMEQWLARPLIEFDFMRHDIQ